MKHAWIALSGLLLLAGCGGEKPTAEGEEAKLKVAVIPKGTSHAFWKSVETGAREAGEQYGVEVMWDGPQKETETVRQRGILESMVNLGAAGVAIAPLDENAMAPPIKRVIDQGLPVVVFDSNVNAEGFVSFVATDNEEGGRIAGRRMVEKLEGREGAKLMIVKYGEGSGSTLRREKGFREIVTEAGHTVVAEQFTDGTPEGALSVATNMMTGLVSDGALQLDGIFASNESTAMGLLRALSRLSNSGVDVSGTVVIGFDSSPDLVKAIESGLYDAVVVQNPERMGFLAVESLVKTLKGEEVAAVQDTGAKLVTKEGLEDPELRKLVE